MSQLSPSIHSNIIYLEEPDFNLHYLESGLAHPKSEVILLLHGWPTSAYLYRKMMEPLAKHYRVIAIDLPGFGKSDKNPDASYSFKYHSNIIQSFLDKLKIEKVHLVVHDLGGPIGMWWAMQHQEQVASYVLLNTIIFPRFSWAVKLFVLASILPILRTWLSSAAGIKFAMRLGIHNKKLLTKEIIAAYQEPFSAKAARKSLLRSAHRLHINGFKDITAWLRDIKKPVLLLYAEEDRILPNVAKTMESIGERISHASLASIPRCGHFLQEERPEAVVEVMGEFYSKL